MFVRLLAALACLGLTCQAADPTANEIMAQVAVNQDKAIQMRSSFVYQQHLDVATRHFSGKLAREEKADYAVTPTAATVERKLMTIAGQCEEKGHLVAFSGEPVKQCGSLDQSLVESFRDELLNEKSKDGLGNDLFPLTTEQQKQYSFRLLGHKQVEGRDTYEIGFSPADPHGFDWAGEALIDVEELQPLRVFTQLSHRIPFAIRTMLGTDLPGVGFNVQYRRVEKDVWFPVSFGSEFRLRAVFFIKRDISVSMQASGFRRTQVDSRINYEVKVGNETHNAPIAPDTPLRP